MIVLYIYIYIYLYLYWLLARRPNPSVREPLSSRPEVERFREAYLKGSLGLPWRRKVLPGSPFWVSRGSILGFQGVHFGPPRGPCKGSAPRKAQPSILGSILGSFWARFGVPGGGDFERTSQRFLVFLQERRTLGKVWPRVVEELWNSVELSRGARSKCYRSVYWRD